MDIDKGVVRSILGSLIESNPLACRAVLSLCSVEFTDRIPSLAVTLGKKSTLKINLGFLQKNCQTEKHIEAVLLHEFLHVLLGHTLKFEAVSPEQNIAMDAVINATIHRVMGDEGSSMMKNYYASQKGVLRLLRPMTTDESNTLWREGAGRGMIQPDGTPQDKSLGNIHAAVYNGSAVADDILEIATQIGGQQGDFGCLRHLLIGGHGGARHDWESLSSDDLFRIREGLKNFGFGGIFRNRVGGTPKDISQPTGQTFSPQWKKSVLDILRVAMVEDKSRQKEPREVEVAQPILTASDKRRFVMGLTGGVVSEYRETFYKMETGVSTRIYLDVSSSMDEILPTLISSLGHFSKLISWPIWAFSTRVYPANIINGQFRSKTSGGTSLECVMEHIAKFPAKRVLLVTDGFVGKATTRSTASRAKITSLLTPNGFDADLSTWGIECLRLPHP